MAKVVDNARRAHRRLLTLSPVYEKAYRRVRPELSESLLHSVATNAVTLPVRSRPLRRTDIVEAMEPAVQFWWLDDLQVGRLRLCAAGSDALELLTCLLNYAASEAVRVDRYDRKSGRPRAADVRQLRDALQIDEYLILVLTDTRSSFPPISIVVEAWQLNEDEHLVTPQNNHLLSRMWPNTTARLADMPQRFNLAELLPSAPAEEVEFDVDWVFSWVNGDDEDWQKLFAAHAPETTTDASDRSRFETRDDLKFALRALDHRAPWIRQIHIVSNCKPPGWLDIAHPRINWVDHAEVIDSANLPTFSSHAIETALHRIPGIATHFVYSNDDFFLLRDVSKEDFFHANGTARLRLESHGVVNGPPADGDPDYLNGARNASALLSRDFGVWPVRLHTHSPQSMNAEVLQEMEQRYSSDFERTQANKFRASSDVAVTGFFYHHYAQVTGRAVDDGASTALIQQNHNYKKAFNDLLNRQLDGRVSPHLSVCVNDGQGSHENADWNASALQFLQQLFPERSEFERPPSRGAT